MNVDIVRQVFSKAAIMTGHKRYSVIYADKDGWVTQELKFAYKNTLEDMIRSCERIGIRVKKGSSVWIIFDGIDTDDRSIVYSALVVENHKSLEELVEDINDNSNDEFFEFFKGVEISDDEELRKKLVEWMDTYDDDENRRIVISDGKRWNDIKNGVLSISGAFGFAVELTDENSGWIELQVPDNTDRFFWFSGKLKETLLETITNSELVSFEMSVKDGYLNIIFFT